jgi:hypothetical protein
MPFNIPNQTSYVKQRPVNPYSGWTRQPDWITITDTPNEVQFLVSDISSLSYTFTTIFTQTGGVGNIYIDWGDGTTDTISTIASTNTSHTYVSGGTACSLGYNTWKVRVYGDAGTRITTAKANIPLLITTNTNFPVGILEAYYGDNTIQSASGLFNALNGAAGKFDNLQYLKLPSVMTGGGSNCLRIMVTDCKSLTKVVMPVSCPEANDVYRMIYASPKLEEVIFPQDAINITSLQETLANCNSLKNVVLPPTLNNLTNMFDFLNGCYNLTSIKLPPLPSCTNYTFAFNNCSSLITIEIPSFTSGATSITTTSMFNACTSLEYVKMPTTVAAGTVFSSANMFSNCFGLKSFIFPTNFDASTMASMFQSCNSLSSCIMPTSMPSLTTMNSAFLTCSNLQEITLPTTVGASITMASTFSTCRNLSKVTIPSGWNLTNLQNTFNTCVSLNEVILPNNAQDNLTTINGICNGCFNLKSIVMPTSLNTCNTMGAAFTSCLNLQSVVFPSTMNAVTSMAQIFQNCSALQSVTLPTSMSALVTANGMFDGCIALKSLTLPTTTGNITTYTQAFRNCFALNSITLPTTQSTALTTLNAAFTNCYGLSGITNQQYLGNTSTGSTIYVDGTSITINAYELLTLDLYTKFSKFEANGVVSVIAKLNSLRLRNNGTGQYAGTSPQINISYTDLGQAALVQVFNDLPTVTSKTINITGATGAAALTAPERAIATGKGWTITG